MADSDLIKETLFSLEVLVDYIKTDISTSERRVLVPAVAVRLLDFPTLLIYRGDKENQEEIFQEDLESEKESVNSELLNHPAGGNGQYFFQKGKSCLFKISFDSLHRHLSNTPLYAIVLDLKNELPKLVGSCLISLAKLTEKIMNDVKEHGISMPSFHGEKGVYTINNLMGERVGYISLGYKLLSLGASLIPHIPENRVLKVGSRHVKASMVQIKENTEKGAHIGEKNIEIKDKPKNDNERGECCMPLTNEANEGSVLLQQIDLEGHMTELIVSESQTVITSVGIQTEPTRRKQYRNIEEKIEFDNETGVFCPPALFYRCSDNEPNEYDAEQYISINVGMEALRVEDLCSQEEEKERDSPAERKVLKCSQDRSKGSTAAATAFEQTQPASAALGDAIRQMPLLNALLVELSLLNSQPQQLPLSVHPHLAWLYRSVDEHSHRATKDTRSRSQADDADTSQTPTEQRSASPRLKQHKAPMKSTPSDLQTQTKKVQRKNIKQENNQKKTASSSPKRKLLYGITNTLRLRLQQTNPDMLICHERREVYRRKQIEFQKAKNSKGFLSKNKKVRESNKVYGEMSSRSNPFDENVQTLMNSLELDSPRIIKTNPPPFNSSEAGNRNKQEKGSQEENTRCYVNVQQPHESVSALSLRDRTKPGPRSNGRDVRVHIPRVFNQDSNQSYNKVENSETSFPHASLNNLGFQSTSLDGENLSPANSGFSSPAQKYSDDFIDSTDVAGYFEDFTSPKPTSRYSAHFNRSPEPVLKSPRHKYSDDDSSTGSNSVRNQRATAPLPVQSDTSPEQSLKRTYPVMLHRKPSASSVSSEASEIDAKHKQDEKRKLGYVKTGVKGAERSLEYKNKPNSGKGHEAVEENHSLRVSQVSSYLSTNDSDIDLSGYKVSTPDLREEDEDRDGLGTLEMVNKYHHISELVGNKLPGYTL
ncbi:microtubule-associated protein 10 [Acipenser ruthenus]|uniref:microtubule-associated protein 10 n=1 Tax=Acipenser ruthenus TaxID=7906 RepID=UPI00145A103A|nr:microtubule-associated protein 10 [Acipenser ruthenus]